VHSLEQLVPTRNGSEHRTQHGRTTPPRSPRARGRIAARRGWSIVTGGDVGRFAVSIAVLAAFPTAATAAPCQYHQGKAKAECVKAHKAQAKRDAARRPAYPVTTRDLTARDIAIARWVRLGRCEAGHGPGYGGVRWNTPSGWRWQGGLGMYDRSHASTGHPYGYDAGRWNWQTQVLVGHRLMEKYGITAWSAWRCW